MGYDLHIKRMHDPISLAEWKTFVAKMDLSVRLSSTPIIARNPKTGAEVMLPGSEGNAEVLIDGEWIPALYWYPGSVSFKARGYMNSPMFQKLVHQLAENLHAKIYGDEGDLVEA